MKRKILSYLFYTTFGPFKVWCAASFVFLAAFVVADVPVLRYLAFPALLLWLLSCLVGFVAFLHAFTHDGRAVVQLLVGVFGWGVFVVALVAALFLRAHVAITILPDVTGWRCSEKTDEIPFSVEFKHSHVFLAEYDKRISFKSGKRIGVWPDTGGGGAFAVYDLGDGMFYLADGLDCDFMRNDYRVNVKDETVEILVGDTWLLIPDGTKSIVSSGSARDIHDGNVKYDLGVKTADGEKLILCDGLPLGDTLGNRRYLGRIAPSGRFHADGIDPNPQIKKLEMPTEPK